MGAKSRRREANMSGTQRTAAPAQGWGHVGEGRAAVLRRKYPTVDDLRARARRRVPRFGFDFVDGAAGGETGKARNRSALEAVELVPRYCIDISNVATEVELFGRRYAAPVGIAPMGMASLAWPGLEDHLARTAQAARIPYVLACVSGAAVERIAPLCPDVLWFQLYRFPRDDHAAGFDMVRRAEAAGAHALVLTVDSPVRTKRPRDLRNGMMVPFRPSPSTIYQVATSPLWLRELMRLGTPRFENFIPYVGADASVQALALFGHSEIKGAYTYDEIARMRERWPRALLVKGILHPDDAKRLVSIGVDGIYVSNHGGRQMEAAPAAIDVLPAIAAEVGSRATVIMDSGIRSGLDVVRAVALGAQAAFTGRPYVYGVAALGEDGARHVADLFLEEVRLAMGQLGACTVDELRTLVRRHPGAMNF
jgi:isopentenyl diphosphate isomerase/L-lactate dehydrogenase-like FMN-dependent dehydrogenase